MNIIGTEYSLSRRALELFLAGCRPPHCKGCHLSESWDFDAGEEITSKKLQHILKLIAETSLVERVMVMGGEPLHQDQKQLLVLLDSLRGTGKEVWLFTRNLFEDVPFEVLSRVDYLKCGEYDESLACIDNIQFGVSLASSNQNIYACG